MQNVFVWVLPGVVLPDKAMPELKEMIEGVKALGLETCMTLGMLNQEQAAMFKRSWS